MKTKRILCLCLAVVSSSVMFAQTAHFKYFSYSGNDERFNKPLETNHQYFNPIRPGFYPDPSVCRVEDTFYLVNSSFSFFPGVPLSTSKDLINWTLLGHVLDRPSQLPLAKQGVSGGVFAPAIAYNEKNKTFYMITTNVGRGNFFVKTKNPSKGWSEPIYLPKVNGIDPSFFFDNNGKGYIVHNAPVVGKADYEGQRAIRLFEFDVNGDSIKSNFKEILRGGTSVEPQPIWIEGPHIFKRGSYYYLMCAEGGTGFWHSEVILRSKSPMGEWEECPHNPILTQRKGLNPNRPDIVTSTGHADLVEDQAGQWWAVFLGCRPYENDFYNTGRDTYLLPVTWKDGWPMILTDKPIPAVNEMKGIQLKNKIVSRQRENLITGNFSYTDRFEGPTLDSRWMFLRNPTAFWNLDGEGLSIKALPVAVSERESLSALWTRQQHTNFTSETQVDFSPASSKELAGFSLLQNEEYNFVFGKTLIDNKPTITLYRAEKGQVLIASASVPNKPLRLRIEGKGRYYSFWYAVDGVEGWQLLARGVDAVNLSTNRSGGFIGACIGLYATTNHH